MGSEIAEILSIISGINDLALVSINKCSFDSGEVLLLHMDLLRL